MTSTAKKQTAFGGGWIIIPLGIWVLISPFVLGYDGEKAGILSTAIVGALLVLVGIMAEWVNGDLVSLSVPLAAWLFISAFVLELWGLPLLWSNVILTFLTMMCAGISEGIRLPRLGVAAPIETAPRS